MRCRLRFGMKAGKPLPKRRLFLNLPRSNLEMSGTSAEMAKNETVPFGERSLTAWEFTRDGRHWRTATVPHDWAIEGPFDLDHDKQVVRIVENNEEKATVKAGRTGALPWIGKGEYRCKVEVPAGAEWASLVFDGAMSEPDVFLDGKRIGGWKYGYTPFEVELPLTGGEVVVKLDNPPLSSRWYPGAGLYRPVTLRWGRRVGVKTWGVDIVTPDLETVDVKVDLRNPGNAAASVRHRVLDAEGRCVAEGAAPLKVKNAHAWSPEDPYLYTLETTVSVDGCVTDIARRRFGIRTLEFGSGYFKLNGKQRKFRGVCLHHDLGPLGAAFSKDAFRRQVRLLKEMGCDSIRTAHNHPAPGQLDVCDEEGMMVMAESFDSWAEPKVENGYNRFFADWWKRDLARLVEYGRGHPSVVMWSVGNEISEQSHKAGAALYAEMQAFVHSCDRDTSRPVTAGASYMPAAIETGFIAAMDIPAVTYRLPFYEAMHSAAPRQGSVLGVETASTVSSRGVYYFPVKVTDRPYHANGQCSGYDVEYCIWSNLPDDDWAVQDDFPWTLGEFVWTGFDYLGEPTPYDDTTPSHSSYFGIFDLAGLPKDRYWLYRSRWRTDDHTLHLVPHWTFPGREGEVTPVYCYTDFDEAELFVNGKSQGRRKKDKSSRLDRYRLRWNEVVYEPGELKVVAYDREGNPAMTEIVRTAGPLATLKIEKQRFGRLLFVTVSAVDEHGTLVPGAADVVEVAAGKGLVFKAMSSGDATSLESLVEPRMKLFHGQLVAIFEGEGEEVFCRLIS
jgi:beta-galactosidase